MACIAQRQRSVHRSHTQVGVPLGLAAREHVDLHRDVGGVVALSGLGRVHDGSDLDSVVQRAVLVILCLVGVHQEHGRAARVVVMDAACGTCSQIGVVVVLGGFGAQYSYQILIMSNLAVLGHLSWVQNDEVVAIQAQRLRHEVVHSITGLLLRALAL